MQISHALILIVLVIEVKAWWTACAQVFGNTAADVTANGGKPDYKWTELRAEEMRRLLCKG